MTENVADCQVNVPVHLAKQMLDAAESLQNISDDSYRQPSTQSEVRNWIHDRCSSDLLFVIDAIRTRIHRRPYWVLLRGLRFDDQNRLLVGLSSILGVAVEPYQTQSSRLVREIRPSTDRHVAGKQVLNEKLHTDGTDWQQPNDLTILACVHPDQNGGGRTRLLDVDTIVSDAIGMYGREFYDVLGQTLMPWKIATELGGQIEWQPIFGPRSIRWLRFTIDAAITSPVCEFPEASYNTLEKFEELVECSLGVMEFAMQANDLLIVNNCQCLHARTAIEDPNNSDRLVLRTKVCFADRRRWD